MSAMDARQSSGFSISIAKKAVVAVVPGYNSMSKAEQSRTLKQADYALRKIAHASEYALLGILMGVLLRKYKKAGLLAIIMCFIYAVSDETHQIFVSGRGPRLTDVLIDTGGAAAAILILYLNSALKRGLQGRS